MSFSHSSFSPEDELEVRTWKTRLLAHQTELLIGTGVLVVLILVFGIGLGGESAGRSLSPLVAPPSPFSCINI